MELTPVFTKVYFLALLEETVFDRTGQKIGDFEENFPEPEVADPTRPLQSKNYPFQPGSKKF